MKMLKKNKLCVFALAGNPNCGKTTLFNELTGSNYEVGNWTGVTVERKEGICRYSYYEHEPEYKNNKQHKYIKVVDLPGIYSMSPYSAEEIITRDYILKDKSDLILNIVDATNLERNLYLTTQLAEAGLPMIVALNMMDALYASGYEIDIKLLQEKLGIAAFPISANKGTGIRELMGEALAIAEKGFACNCKVRYDDDIEECIRSIIKVKPMSRLSCIKLLNGEITDPDINIDNIKSVLVQDKENFEDRITKKRYSFIRAIAKQCRKKTGKNKQFEVTEKIDDIAMHPLFAMPIFILIMFLIFQITFGAFGSSLTDIVDYLFNVRFAAAAERILLSAGVSDFVKSLVTDGIIAGVGGVVTFFPQIMLLFLFLSFLEDSGYMARVAFIMDKIFMKFGLSGKAFVPMIMGFGCTVPAVMSARTLDNERDRRLAILIMPFMSCGAKMPVYAMIVSAIFAEKSGVVITSLYVIGIALGIISSLIFSKTILRGDKPSFVLELPAYRMPTAKSTFHHMWEKAEDFMIRAGTVLLAGSIIIWFMHNLSPDLHPVGEAGIGIIEVIGEKLAPVFSPCGFGIPEAAVSLISGFTAKETIISTMSILYNVNDTAALADALSCVFTPLSAYSFLIFVLLYTPCMAAISAIKTELNSWRLTIFSIVYQISLAWLLSMVVFQIGNLF